MTADVDGGKWKSDSRDSTCSTVTPKKGVSPSTNDSAWASYDRPKLAGLSEVISPFKAPPSLAALLNERSVEGQQARLEALQGLWVVLICCGTDQTKQRFFKKAKHDLAMNILLVEEESNNFAVVMEDCGDINHWIRFDMQPREGILSECLDSILEFARSQRICLSGCTTFWDDAVGLAARIQEVLELPGNPVHSVDVAHDKYASRKFLEQQGLPCPAHFLLTCEADLSIAAPHVGFPAILKPLYGAASIAVLKVDSEDDLLSKYRSVVDMLAQTYAEGDLMGLYFLDAEGVGNSAEDLRHVVMEEYLDGPEVDVDMVMSQGQIVYCNVVDDWPVRAPWHCEVGNNAPSLLPLDQQAELRLAAADIVQGLGYICGVLHVEMKFTSRGPRLLEVNPRMGGGPIRDMHLGAFNIDLVEEVLIAAVGLPNNPPALNVTTHTHSVASVQLFAHKSGVLKDDMAAAAERILLAYPGVLESGPFVSVGDKITSWCDGFPTHLGRVSIRAASMEDAIRLSHEVQDSFQVFVDKNVQ